MKMLAAGALLVLAQGCHDHGHDHDDGHGGHDHDDGASGHEHGQEHEDEHGHGHGEGATAITHFSEGTELFVEVPPLVVGQPSEPAAHVTTLADWRPVDAGVFTVELSGGGAPAEVFSADKPDVPGIFRPVITPRHAGLRTVIMTAELPGGAYVHPCGQLQVHADEGAAHAAAEAKQEHEDPGAISFLKEQAWKMDFAMERVVSRPIRPAFEAYGTLRARSDGEAHVTAPVAGRLAVGGRFPRIGLEVKRGDVLAALTPRLAEAGDAAALAQATGHAEIAVRRAEEERKRLDKLLESGAIPERRVIEGRYAAEQARQALATARRRQRQAQRLTGTHGAGEDAVTLRAPMPGTLVSVEAAPGAFVEQGDHLFRVVDLDRLWLEVHVVETHAAMLDKPQGVWFEIEGFDEPFEAPAQAVIAAGGELDRRSRTVPLLVAIDNPGRRLRVGMFADVRVITGAAVELPAVPVSAVVWEAGLPVVYIQLGGEEFARRPVMLGDRDGRVIAVTAGVAVGERVVTRGAYAVRLAGAAPAEAGHGHHH